LVRTCDPSRFGGFDRFMAYSGSDPIRTGRNMSKEAPGASSNSKYRFRADVEIARDGDAGGAGSNVTVIDPRSGERHVFTADEFALCKAADGTNSLAAIQRLYKVETGRDITLGKLFAFFRLLRSKRLLEEPAKTVSEGTQPEAGTEPADEPATTQIASAVVAVAPSPQMDAAPSDHNSDDALAAPSLPTEPNKASLARATRRARRQQLWSRWEAGRRPSLHATAAKAAPTNAAESATAATKAAVTDQVEKPTAAKGLESAAREDFEDLEYLGLPESAKNSGPASRPGLRRRHRDAGRTDADAQREADGQTSGSEAPGTSAALEGQTDPRGVGGFRGGMGGGGPGAALRGGLEGRRLGGAAVQNFLAGLAARARAREEEDAAGANEPARLSLFNPNTVLGILAAVFRPLKYVFLLLLLAVPVTVWIAYQQRALLAQDVRSFDVSVVGTAILGLVIVNLISRVAQGTVIRSFGAEVKQFGIALTFAIPRFFVDLGGTAALSRRGQLWVHAAPPIARLGLFCAGTLLWFAFRQSAPWPAHLALVVGQIGLFTFLLSALPLLPSDGYRWLATYFGRPALRSDAFRSVVAWQPGATAGGEAPGSRSAATFYVAAIALAVSMLALVVQADLDVAATGDVHVITASLLLALCVALAAWVIALWNYGRSHEIDLLDSTAAQKVLARGTGAPDIASDRPASIGAAGKVFWAVVAAVLVALAFLPYHYDAGGTFEILPTERTRVAVRTSGEVAQVLVREGDWVKANQPLAKLSSDDQQRDVNITRAELERAKAQLAQFGDKAATQESDPGLDALHRSIADALGDEADSAGANKDSTDTSYFKTQAERAARAEVERLIHKLAYERDQLADTTVRAPNEGRVVTPNVHLLTGTFLRRGSELLSLADTRTLEAEINLPEADVELVKVGDKVRLRTWSNEDREIAGTVTAIAPAAQSRLYGMVVRVRASIPNQDALLLPAMTGYAKIDGEEMRVWEAFLRRIIRIVRVEVWSWIP
jgi:multidrug efflux pump subunit AcrA (membrane-fusion protein)